MKISDSTKKKIPYIIGFVIVIYSIKPLFFFKLNGKPRQYGIGVDEEGYNKTLYTFQFLIILFAILLLSF